MLKGHAGVAQIRVLERDDFVAEGRHNAGGGAVLADFQVKAFVNVDDEVLQRRRQVFG